MERHEYLAPLLNRLFLLLEGELLCVVPMIGARTTTLHERWRRMRAVVLCVGAGRQQSINKTGYENKSTHESAVMIGFLGIGVILYTVSKNQCKHGKYVRQMVCRLVHQVHLIVFTSGATDAGDAGGV
jgi:hypothetical protein